jgi:hypothetical protein
MNRRIKSISILSTLLVLLAGCYPQGPEYVEDMDIVLTYNEGNYDFAAKQTYARPNSIVKITGNLVGDDEPEFLPDAVADVIIAQIDKNMEALGWELVDLESDPDILLMPASWETTTVMYYYDYWYWWYGGYYPPYGYYPGYVSSYSTGTLMMNITDPSVISGNGNPIVQWTGAINGILTYSFDANRVNKAVDRAFEQSPYLKTN